ncbi:MAG TPA: threonine synthase, partial [bacterium]|nr:threonine synthase [bacterium]
MVDGSQAPREASLLDAVHPDVPVSPDTFRPDRGLVTDPGADLDVRLEAFENIFESEIGDTSLTRARNVEREVGLRQLHLKFEGSNTTGT